MLGPSRLRRSVLFAACMTFILAILMPFSAHAEENREVVRVGWYESPFNYTDASGRRSGYAYEYQQKIAAYTGWEYEYVEASWPDLLNMLKAGEIDLMSDVSYTEERAKEMLFPSLPMGAESYYVFVAAGNEEMESGDPSTLQGKRVGVNKDSYQAGLFRAWAKANGVDAEVIELSGAEDESIQMMIQGEIDAFVTIDAYGDASTYVPVFKIGQSEFFFAVSNARPDLLMGLNVALGKIQDEDGQYNQRMYDKYVRSVGTNAFLSSDETGWLDDHGAVRVGYRDGYLPFCDYDEAEARLVGALGDYLTLSSDSMQNATVQYETVPYATTDEALEALAAGEIDCVFPVNLDACDGEELGISVTNPVMETEVYAAVRRDDHLGSLSGQDMTVAVNRGNLNYEVFLKDNFPEWEVVYCDGAEDGFRMVSAGEADCMLFSNYRIAQTESLRKRYKLAALPTGKAMSLSFAVRLTDGELYHILNKASGLVPSATVESSLLSNSWPDGRLSLWDLVSENLPFVIVTIIAIAAVVVLLLVRRSNRMRAQYEERLRLQGALSAALAEAEEANKAKTAFLSSMSHEIRTPMNAIIGLDTLALRDETLSGQTRDYLRKIGESAHHLLSLINEILDMSRIESGRMTLRREEFSFSSMLEQINTMVTSQCAEKGLDYECLVLGHVDDHYVGDDMKLKEVLINILSNAVKFTDAPGSVTLTVERTASFEDKSTLRFRVRDTGIGMDEEYLPKLFDAFSQEDSSNKNKYGSTGLGMAITKSIVEMMNGTIEVESQKGVGTEFAVTVTLRNCGQEGTSLGDSIDPQSLRVLVVDDDEVAGEHGRMVLDEVGIRADVCDSGAEALRMMEVQSAKQQPYNLVLMDWNMPGMNGLEASEKIREHYGSESTAVVLTAYNWDDIEEEARRVGVDSFLPKPLFASSVVEEFERIARRSNMGVFAEKGQADLAGRCVLLAEDIQVNAEIMMDVLELEDIECDHAENGRVAVEMFEASAPGTYAAILMDVRMPEMDGLEAAVAIRALDREDARRIPIVALTANAFDEDVERSLQAGMNAHLNKPVEPDHLLQVLAELVFEAERS